MGLINVNFTLLKIQASWVDDVNIDKILIFSKAFLVKKDYKYFFDYKVNYYEIKPLCRLLPKMSRYVKSFDETKYTYILINDDELRKKYNKIWDKVSNSIKKEFETKPVYNQKYLKNKIKMEKKFHDNGKRKEGSHCIFFVSNIN